MDICDEGSDNLTKKLTNCEVFEICTEVTKQVGGVHTVMKTKALTSSRDLGDDYCLIGVLPECAQDIETMEPVGNSVMQYALKYLRNDGHRVVYGRWLIEGLPKVVLIDVEAGMDKLDAFKASIWDDCNIGIPRKDNEANEAVVFGCVAMQFLEKYRNMLPSSKRMLAHFHEWMAGVGLIATRARKLNIATVFTTHATQLGRHLCASQTDFYHDILKFNPNKEAGDRCIYQRYCIERASAHVCHVFTTVSEILGYEVEHLLNKKPDVVLPNGLNIDSEQNLQSKHQEAKQKIHAFVKSHFHGHMDFNPDKTLYFFSAGRYEYANKGVDMLIESLARLNHKMTTSNDCDVTVVVFLIFPAINHGPSQSSVNAKIKSNRLSAVVDEVKEEIGKQLFESCLKGEIPQRVLNDKHLLRLKQCLVSMEKSKTPPHVCTHKLADESNDEVLKALKKCHLFNGEKDRVKVVFHPQFLTPNSPLLNMEYDSFSSGCDMGVFPSYYEPWGYTPAECVVNGVASITTNLSGFGCFIQKHISDPADYGVFIVDRRFKSVEESLEQLTKFMFDFCQQTSVRRSVLRHNTMQLGELLNWNELSMNYNEARLLALERLDVENHKENRRSLTEVSTSKMAKSKTLSNSKKQNTKADANNLKKKLTLL